MFYDDDLGTENNFFPVCLISEYASVTINVYLYSIHLGIWDVTAVFQFPFNSPAPITVTRVNLRRGISCACEGVCACSRGRTVQVNKIQCTCVKRSYRTLNI